MLVDLHNEMIGRMRRTARPVIEAGLVDVVEGMELAEVMFGDQVFLRDTIATKEIVQELADMMRETGLYCAIKVRARLPDEVI